MTYVYFLSFPQGREKYLKSTPNLFPQREETPVTREG